MGVTWLEERNREKAREEAEARRLADALERHDETEFIIRFGPAFIAGGHCLFEPRRDESERVEVILRRDRTDRLIEIDRQVAGAEVTEGVYFNLSDVVISPTPEWLAKHETAVFVPKQPDDTVRVIKTVRVVRTPVIARLWRAGKISDEIGRACLWYRETHEIAGLNGSMSFSSWCGPDHIRDGASGAMAAGHMPKTMREAEARQEFRQAVIAIDPFYREFFDQIVIHDVSLRHAARFAKCANDKVLRRFLDAAEDLLDHLEARQIELPAPYDLHRS